METSEFRAKIETLERQIEGLLDDDDGRGRFGMINDEKVRPLQERLQALADFLPLFEQSGFEFGEWIANPKSETGVLMMPYYSWSDTAHLFVKTAYDTGWVLNFDWPAWKQTDEAIGLRDDAAALAAAAPEQLARLLTVLIRQDRFVEGALGSAYEAGLLMSILRRAAELVTAPDEGQFT